MIMVVDSAVNKLSFIAFFSGIKNFYCWKHELLGIMCTFLLVYGEHGVKYFSPGVLKMAFPKDKAFCKIKYNSRVMLFPLRLLTILSRLE